MKTIFDDICSKRAKISVTGLGYVGLPLAHAFASKFQVVAYDHNTQRVEMLRNHIDSSNEIQQSAFNNLDITYTSNANDLEEARLHIIAVPTPIDNYNKPDLSLLLSATKTIAQHIKRGDIIVYESTVYPGCTEEECLPILEKESNLKCGIDFGLGYSPERINPGDKTHTLSNVIKIVSGYNDEIRNIIASIYGKIITAGIHIAPSIKVAEAAKIIENTQRDVNIALMNELSIIFSRLGIDTRDVLDAANTKWNFINFHPGLVGGHCIGVDPYYLDYKACELGYHTQIINRGRYVNDSMGKYVAKVTIKRIINKGFNLSKSHILIMGFTYKENVCDVRNTKIADIYEELKSYGIHSIDIVDPIASADDVQRQYGLKLSTQISGKYEAIIIAVAHNEYCSLNKQFFKEHLVANGIVADIKGIYKDKFTDIDMWRL